MQILADTTGLRKRERGTNSDSSGKEQDNCRAHQRGTATNPFWWCERPGQSSFNPANVVGGTLLCSSVYSCSLQATCSLQEPAGRGG